MLTIIIPSNELYDEETNTFIVTKEQVLQMEHSLVSISKWESRWLKPYLGKQERTKDEMLDYLRCMTTTQNVDKDVYNRLTEDNLAKIADYINSPMTATIINDTSKRVNTEIITSELIYNWMISFTIPFECQKWHLNRLMTLIRICNIKNEKPKKMSKSEIMSKNKALNEARRKANNTKG